MEAIETFAKIDKKGFLRIDKPLRMHNRNVKVIILFNNDDEFEEETLWLTSISNNPAFNFLKDTEEDIYSLNDGKPFVD